MTLPKRVSNQSPLHLLISQFFRIDEQNILIYRDRFAGQSFLKEMKCLEN